MYVDSTSSEMNLIRQKAINENKSIDMIKYDAEFKSAKTVEQKQAFYENLEKYAINTSIEYIPNLSNKSTNSITTASSTPVVGDTMMYTYTYYAMSTEWSAKSAQTFSYLVGSTISIFTGWAHTGTGVFMSSIGLFIAPYDYDTYKGILIRSLLDYQINVKQAKVYQYSNGKYFWAPMATTEKRYTNCQINTVYYKNTVRQPEINKSLGLVKEEYGTYYLDETRLISLAKNTSSPLYWSYNTGTAYTYNNDYKFSY